MYTIGMDTYPLIFYLHLHMVEISTGRRFFAEELRRKPAEIGGPNKSGTNFRECIERSGMLKLCLLYLESKWSKWPWTCHTWRISLQIKGHLGSRYPDIHMASFYMVLSVETANLWFAGWLHRDHNSVTRSSIFRLSYANCAIVSENDLS